MTIAMPYFADIPPRPSMRNKERDSPGFPISVTIRRCGSWLNSSPLPPPRPRRSTSAMTAYSHSIRRSGRSGSHRRLGRSSRFTGSPAMAAGSFCRRGCDMRTGDLWRRPLPARYHQRGGSWCGGRPNGARFQLCLQPVLLVFAAVAVPAGLACEPIAGRHSRRRDDARLIDRSRRPETDEMGVAVYEQHDKQHARHGDADGQAVRTAQIHRCTASRRTYTTQAPHH